MGSTSWTFAAVTRELILSDWRANLVSHCFYSFPAHVMLRPSRTTLQRHCATSFFLVELWEWTYGNLNTVIGEDESGVGSGELGGRHCDRRCELLSKVSR